MKADYKRFEVNLRPEYLLEHDIVSLYQKIPERSRSGIFRRQILAVLEKMDQKILAGEVPDHTSALYVLAREFGLSNLDISTYLPDFDYTAMQVTDLNEINNDDAATQNLTENGRLTSSELAENRGRFAEINDEHIEVLVHAAVSNSSENTNKRNDVENDQIIKLKDDLRGMLDW